MPDLHADVQPFDLHAPHLTTTGSTRECRNPKNCGQDQGEDTNVGQPATSPCLYWLVASQISTDAPVPGHGHRSKFLIPETAATCFDGANSIGILCPQEFNDARLDGSRGTEVASNGFCADGDAEADRSGQGIQHAQVFEPASHCRVGAERRVALRVVVNVTRVWMPFQNLKAGLEAEVINETRKLTETATIVRLKLTP